MSRTPRGMYALRVYQARDGVSSRLLFDAELGRERLRAAASAHSIELHGRRRCKLKVVTHGSVHAG